MPKSYRSCVTNLSICKANCCTNGVWVDLEQSKAIKQEVLSRSEFSDLHQVELFSQEIDDVDYFPSGKAIGTALKTSDGPCIFLGSDFKCRIYQFRPHFCADYPLMHPMESSNEPILIDNLFESDSNCIYNGLLTDTLKSIEMEKEETSLP